MKGNALLLTTVAHDPGANVDGYPYLLYSKTMVRESDTLLQAACDRLFGNFTALLWKYPTRVMAYYYLPYVPHEYITQQVGGSNELSLYGILEAQLLSQETWGPTKVPNANAH